tara:strand:+ start:10 stop:750 length:741 start_codon:yes stop_codon:yes gene_type:complete
MTDLTFYDNTPFAYGYSSKEEIISNMNPLLMQLMEQNAGKVFCDIGCGCGRNLLYASNFANKLIGIDLSKESLEYAKNFLKCENLDLIIGDNLDIPIDSEIADLVISDGVCHHTGDAVKAFKECVRILKPSAKLYLAIYKKYRYYPYIYYIIGGFFRLIKNFKLGHYIIEKFCVKIHYRLYKIFKKQTLSEVETRNIFYDYFLTPVASFHSKDEVNNWCKNNNCNIINYSRTSGNCHIFIIRKNGK